MFSFKIWPLVLTVYSFLVGKDSLFLSATYIPNELSLNFDVGIGGYVGCLFTDVCLPTEVCQNDQLFGRCVDVNLEGSANELTNEERSLLFKLRLDFLRVGLNFDDRYVQCVFRGLILKFRLQDKKTDLVRLCGEVPTEVVGLGGPHFLEMDKTPFYDQPYPVLKRSFRAFDTYDTEENLFENAFDSENGGSRTQFAELIPSELEEMWTYDREELPLPHVVKPLNEGHMVKRFNREKVVKFSTAEFDRRTKNSIWLRFSKAVNYLEADLILQELSGSMDIRPPIAQFQLDKTGHVLLFFVPFETGMVAMDVINMMLERSQWLKENRVTQYGIGIPILTEPKSAPHTASKIEQLSESGEPPTINPDRRQTRLNSGFGGQFSRIGFVVVVVICSLTALVALILFAHTLIRRRDRLNGYLPGGVSSGKDSRKPSERPLVQADSPSPSGSVLNASALGNGNDSPVKQSHQESTSSYSTNSPPPYQEPAVKGGKQDTFRRQLLSTGGSEASTESMAGFSNNRTSNLSSNSSWRDEPIQMALDVTTGHLILSYMEEHLKNRDRLDADWEEIKTYESEEAVPCEAAQRPENARKNRDGCPIPYEQTRVMLSCRSDGYINASLMYDHDPRNPSYIAAETPLLSTVGDFWQMVWEQFVVVIVCLEPESALIQVSEDPFNIIGQGKNDTVSQARYWPSEGCLTFGKFEVRLVSEHRQRNEYITRSFYLKEKDSGETRTITQFHFLMWPEDTPSCEVKTLLEFRRKVNKSFRAKNSPVIVHCRDGSSKTGTYLLLDLVLSRINKGVKELDVAASLEHLRDQRQGMIETKGQFELVLAAIAEEVNMMLKSAAAP